MTVLSEIVIVLLESIDYILIPKRRPFLPYSVNYWQ